VREIKRVGELICNTIDFEQSKESSRTAVRPGIDSRLDELKRHYDGMEHFLSQVASRLIQKMPSWAAQYIHSCTFFPQLGFLIAVRLNLETGKGWYDGEGLAGDAWEPMFVNEGFVYYKNGMMKELDGQDGDVYCMIVGKYAWGPVQEKTEEKISNGSKCKGRVLTSLSSRRPRQRD